MQLAQLTAGIQVWAPQACVSLVQVCLGQCWWMRAYQHRGSGYAWRCSVSTLAFDTLYWHRILAGMLVLFRHCEITQVLLGAHTQYVQHGETALEPVKLHARAKHQAFCGQITHSAPCLNLPWLSTSCARGGCYAVELTRLSAAAICKAITTALTSFWATEAGKACVCARARSGLVLISM